MEHIFNWALAKRYIFAKQKLVCQLVSGEHMHLMHVIYKPGATYKMHSHPWEQFSIMISGKLLLTVGDDTRQIGPGECFYAPATVPHGGKVIGNETLAMIDVYSPAEDEVIEDLKTGLVKPPLPINTPLKDFFR